MPAVELATIRYAVFVAMAGSRCCGAGALPSAAAARRCRSCAASAWSAARVAFILSLGTLPIAEATAINFITPLLITVLAIPVLGETVRPQGWVAVLVGFVGMLVVVRPGVGGLHPAALLVLLSSLCWCIAMLVTRRLVGVDRSAVTLLWTACTGFVLLLCAVPFFLAPLTLRQAALCLAGRRGRLRRAVAGRAGLPHARATVLAPLTYAQLIWSSVLGYLVFRTVPDRWTLVGAVIIAASGLRGAPRARAGRGAADGAA